MSETETENRDWSLRALCCYVMLNVIFILIQMLTLGVDDTLVSLWFRGYSSLALLDPEAATVA